MTDDLEEYTKFQKRLVEEAKSLIIKHFAATKPDYRFDIVNAGFCPWEDDCVVAVTISERSRATYYEVWEVCFTTDSAWTGEGTFGRVAHTYDIRTPADPNGPDLQFDEFGFNLDIQYEVSGTRTGRIDCSNPNLSQVEK